MTYQIRQLDYEHDKEFLITIIRDNLSRNMNIDKTVAWNYQDNPIQNSKGHVLEYIAEHDHAKNVGVLSIAYRDFYCGRRKIHAALCGDFVVATGHRTLSPALKLIKESVAAELESCPFVYGFPNDKALGVLKMAGFRVVGKLTRFACVLRTGKYLNDKIRIPIVSYPLAVLIDLVRNPLMHFHDVLRTQNINISETRWFGEDIDNIARESIINNLVFNCRTSAYLNWRYFMKPDNAYVGIVCRSSSNNCPLSYAVVEHEQATNTVHVRELLFFDSSSFNSLLAAIRIWADKHNADSISLSIMAPKEIEEHIIHNGFSSRESVRHVLVRSNDSNLLQFLQNKDKWFVLDGDEDQ